MAFYEHNCGQCAEIIEVPVNHEGLRPQLCEKCAESRGFDAIDIAFEALKQLRHVKHRELCGLDREVRKAATRLGVKDEEVIQEALEKAREASRNLRQPGG